MKHLFLGTLLGVVVTLGSLYGISEYKGYRINTPAQREMIALNFLSLYALYKACKNGDLI